MNTDIAVTGSIAFDHIMNFPGKFKEHILPDKLHILNVSFLVQDLRRQRGGCAANIAYSAALLGLNARLVGAVGSDFAEYRAWLTEQGIDLTGVQVHQDLLTASCFITTDGDNNQITGFYPGAMAHGAEAKLSGLSGQSPALATISPNDPAAMKAYPSECREQGIPFLYDPGQQVIALTGDDLLDGVKGAKVVVTNDYEASVLQDKTKLSVDALLEHCEALVVTLGGQGCRVHIRGEGTIEVPAAPVGTVNDPTGAGDAFRGGLSKGIVSGCDWETSARLGTVAAAYCVEVHGTSAYAFTREQFDERFERAFGLAPSVP